MIWDAWLSPRRCASLSELTRAIFWRLQVLTGACTCGIYTPAKEKMDDEIAEINTWINEQTRLMCVKLEMGGDMNTLTAMLEELRKEF